MPKQQHSDQYITFDFIELKEKGRISATGRGVNMKAF